MRLWLNRNAEVPLREQLITQVVLAILTREGLPGQRLPSTRELARRFGIHPNTASAAYRQLRAARRLAVIARKPLAKVKLRVGRTGICATPASSYSTGSSMVTIFFSGA